LPFFGRHYEFHRAFRDLSHEATTYQFCRIAHPQAEQAVDLDWLRIGASGCLILYHVGML